METKFTPKSAPNTRLIGIEGERLAEQYLTQKGLYLVERNFNSRYGEIDLIMRDKDCLVFVEVRQRKSTTFGLPIETVNLRKQKKLRLTAEYYCLCKKVSPALERRFDVFGIVAGKQQNSIEWVSNAF